MEAYERIHTSFSRESRTAFAPGTFAQVIDAYRSDAEYGQLKPQTHRNYNRWLDWLKLHHGRRPVANFPREAALKMRKEHMARPSNANMLMAVLRMVLYYAEERPLEFRLPKGWQNPMSGMKRMKGGKGHIPWEEDEIDAFRARWNPRTIERVIFEIYLNTGQRGSDIAPMHRSQYRGGLFYVVQTKTDERVWIPTADDLQPVLDPWLASHDDKVFFPTAPGRSINPTHMRKVMRAAITAAGLPDTRTLHGLRYTFATRGIELGMDYQTIESIVGHETMEMAMKYTGKRRRSRLAINTWNSGLRQNRESRLPVLADAE
jgi:integrase